MSQFVYQQHYERNLPHLQPPQATLFVTFRLDGSIPASVLEEWRLEKRRLEMEVLRWEAQTPAGANPDPAEIAVMKLSFARRWFKKFESLLDGATQGPLWLKEADLAAIVEEALRRRDGSVYRLDAYCVMPNHVHAVFAPLLTEEIARELASAALQGRAVSTTLDETATKTQLALASIMQSLKGWTARQCNLALGRTGQFWQHESFDHVIRDQAEWERLVTYVVNNPVKAGFVNHWQDWQWSYRRAAPP